MAVQAGERKQQILQTLAHMLENPRGEKITTAALAARLDVSEAALYRHFASKAQMYEGLIEFIEHTLFGLINRITSEEANSLRQIDAILSLLLGFAQKNPGMTRVLIGEVLVNEDERLQQRVNQLHDRLEASLKQAVKLGVGQQQLRADLDAGNLANLLVCVVDGRWHQFVKSGFKCQPMDGWEAQRDLLLGGV